jgi:hypothetical protein
MVTITTDVEIDLDNFDTWELREELEARGYYVTNGDPIEDLDECHDSELIHELQDRGYTVYGKKADLVWEIYQSYLLDDDKKFRAIVAQILKENGYKP